MALFWLMAERGRSPHEIARAVVDGPGPIEPSLIYFDFLCMLCHQQWVASLQQQEGDLG